VYMSGSRSTVNCHKNSPQTEVNTIIPKVANAGSTIGSTTFLYILKLDAPSNFAASINSSETDSLIYCLIKNIPSGFRKDKIITPCNVSNKPALAMVKYCGIKPNCGGIIIVSIIATKSAFFPGNLNFANAYPANELINNTTIVTTIQRTSEFHIAPKKSI